MGSFEPNLSDYASNLFKNRGIAIHTGQSVAKVTAKTLELKNNTEVPYGVLLWSTGLAPNELVKGLNVSKDRTKRLLTDRTTRLYDLDMRPLSNVFAMGDCATVKDYDLPCTAQVAKQKAAFVAKELNQLAKRKNYSMHHFVYRHRGSMAYLGGWRAVVDMKKGSAQRGLLGWMIWRTAYVSMADSLRNKIKIPVYWGLTWLVGRETSRF